MKLFTFVDEINQCKLIPFAYLYNYELNYQEDYDYKKDIGDFLKDDSQLIYDYISE